MVTNGDQLSIDGGHPAFTELKTVVHAKLENGTVQVVFARGGLQREPLFFHRGGKLGRPDAEGRSRSHHGANAFQRGDIRLRDDRNAAVSFKRPGPHDDGILTVVVAHRKLQEIPHAH